MEKKNPLVLLTHSWPVGTPLCSLLVSTISSLLPSGFSLHATERLRIVSSWFAIEQNRWLATVLYHSVFDRSRCSSTIVFLKVGFLEISFGSLILLHQLCEQAYCEAGTPSIACQILAEVTENKIVVSWVFQFITTTQKKTLVFFFFLTCVQ